MPLYNQEAVRKSSQKAKKQCSVIAQYWWAKVGKHIFLMMLMIGLAFAGAPVFYYLEAPFEREELRKAQNETIEKIELFAEQLVNISVICNLRGFPAEECYARFLNSVMTYEKENLDDLFGDSKYSWDFWNSMFYAGTIFTTIGYGHLYCKTFFGRLATIIYAFVGIPIMLAVLDDMGKLLMEITKWGWKKFKSCAVSCFCRHRQQSVDIITDKRHASVTSSATLRDENLPLPIAIFVLIAYTFGCSATFKLWETEWDYFTAFYFFFISLSTVGLGDIVPDHPKYTMLGFGYIIVGLSLVSMVINIIQAHFQSTYIAALAEFENRFQFMDSDSIFEEQGIVPDYYRQRSEDLQPRASLGIMQVTRTPSRRRESDLRPGIIAPDYYKPRSEDYPARASPGIVPMPRAHSRRRESESHSPRAPKTDVEVEPLTPTEKPHVSFEFPPEN